MKKILIAALATVLLAGAGCKKKQPAPAPPVTLPPPIQQSTKPVVVAPNVEAAPAAVPKQTPPTDIVSPKPNVAPPPETPAKKPAAKPKTTRRGSARTAPPQAPPVKETPQAVPPQAPPVKETPPAAEAKPPQLGELLDETQRAAYAQQYDESIALAKKSLAAASGSKLNAAQSDAVQRIEGFIKEAEQFRATDIRTASQLAARAASLGRDLQSSLR